MRPTDTDIRAISATAATYLPDTDQMAAPRDLIRAVNEAIERRYEDEHLSLLDIRRLREATVEALGAWSTRWTRKALAGELRDIARQGLDLTELVGERYGHAAGRIWYHGAYSASRVNPRLLHPQASGLSHSGRPWVNLWMDDDGVLNPTILRAEFAA